MSDFQKFALVVNAAGYTDICAAGLKGIFNDTHAKVSEVDGTDHLLITIDDELGYYDSLIDKLVSVLNTHPENYRLIDFRNYKHEMWPEIETYGRYYDNAFCLGTRVSFKYFAQNERYLSYA